MNDRLLDLEAVRQIVPLGRSTIYRKMARGEFPKPGKHGGRRLWRESAVRAYVEQDVVKACSCGAALTRHNHSGRCRKCSSALRASSYTPEEDAIIRQHYPENGSTKVAAMLTGRSADSVRARAKALRVKLDPEVRNRLINAARGTPRPRMTAFANTEEGARANRKYRANAQRQRDIAAKALAEGKGVLDLAPALRWAARDLQAANEAAARKADPVEQAKTILRRRYTPVVSMAFTESGGPADRYQVGTRSNVSEQDLIAMARSIAA